MEGYIAEVRYFAGNFEPRGWMFCKGQLLAISQYETLFALIGATYGGDGVTTFMLPNFAGRAGVGTLQGTGLTNRVLGQQFGSETVSLTSQQMPQHTHGNNLPVSGLTLNVSAIDATKTDPAVGDHLANLNETGINYLGYIAAAPDTALAAQSVDTSSVTVNMTNVGGSLPHDNMQPFLVLNYIICVEGIFPSRN
ncbi:phage tail protein [Sphingobacterium tabacisoli]|uniref:Phage tail protein n=1 Tax=Sphingobacterium tabacisoli TaxID=2044855 RepID=A0ABW5L6W3_9SPHI|nr:tail fiber protein [Sphingobacterium tabacisoli]